MPFARFLLLFACLLPLHAQSITSLLARVSEEADTFHQNIVKALTEETLDQRTAIAPHTFLPRIGKGATAAPRTRIQVRHIVSEYTVGTFRQTGTPDLHEFRQVVSVDGRPVQSAAEARHALSLGMQSEDDRLRKRMLENFASHGLVDVATDYGLILLEFSRRNLPNLAFSLGPERRLGTAAILTINWTQKSAAEGQLTFSGRRTVRTPLSGILWIRKSDGLPLRIETWADYTDAHHKIRDHATVDYTMSPHGFLTPVSVLHRHLVDGNLITENAYTYRPFKMFGADAEIEFTLPTPQK
jgi:hypothetical protein